MTSNPSDLARLFQSQYADFDEDIPLWLELARRHAGPVLELGCGTGRVLEHLADAGHAVTGIDSSAAMLHRARQHLRRHPPERITLLQADLKAFSIDQQYPLAIAPLNVLAELDDTDLAQTLSTVREHLTAGGVLAADLPNPRDALSLPADDGDPIQTFTEQDTGHAVQVSAHHRHLPSSHSVVVTWHYDELLPNGMVSRHRFETTFHLRTPEILRTMLEASGFAAVDMHGDYSSGALRNTSRRMVFTATNQI